MPATQESSRVSQDEQAILSYKLYQHEREIENFYYGYNSLNNKKIKLSVDNYKREKGNESNLIIIKDVQIANKQQ